MPLGRGCQKIKFISMPGFTQRLSPKYLQTPLPTLATPVSHEVFCPTIDRAYILGSMILPSLDDFTLPTYS